MPVTMAIDEIDPKIKYAMAACRNVVLKYEAPPGYDRQDLFQAAMISILETIENRPDLGTGGWMGKRAHYAIRDEIRRLVGRHSKSLRRRIAFKSVPLDAQIDSDDGEFNPFTLGASDDLSMDMEYLLDMLTPEEQELCLLMAQGYQQQEVAQMWGVKIQSMHWRMMVIRKKLRKHGIDQLFMPA